jgi:hypothetical protein
MPGDVTDKFRPTVQLFAALPGSILIRILLAGGELEITAPHP